MDGFGLIPEDKKRNGWDDSQNFRAVLAVSHNISQGLYLD
jgi:hypothetical protein